jgi:amino acid transporter/GNAT superfamily N-acetyltransferase
MNMSNMVGVGPFLTIPLILGSMGGPQAMLGWIAGTVLAICDGMVWAELASAVPSSGGTLEYLKVAYRGTRLGRLLPFLFVWQFILSGPLEVASGNIGFAKYFAYIVPMTVRQQQWLAVGVGALAVLLLYRKIESVGKLMVALWAGVMVTIAAVLVCGLPYFQADVVFDFPPDAFQLSGKLLFGLGAAMSLAMYDFLGYYSVCYIGDEVRNPSRTIPRSILISVIAVAAIYLTMNISIISVVPWRDAMHSESIASDFMERLGGRTAGVIMAAMICWTAFASVFALLLAYSRIPYAAARDGFFFSAFACLHPRGDFPHVSLLALGGIAMGASFFPLDDVISALITTRIVVQFIAQIAAASRLRWQPVGSFHFRMALYPLPSLIALLGWVFIFSTAELEYKLVGSATLVVGVVAYIAWSWYNSRTERLATAMKPQVIDENDIPPSLDEQIRAGSCLCFPADVATFSKSRAWHGSTPEYSVFVRDAERVIAHAGIVNRTITVGGAPLRVAGVQNVFVLPEYRGKGLSDLVLGAAMAEAMRRGFDYGMLFCLPSLAKVYARCGWQDLGEREVVRVEDGRELPLPEKNIAMFYPLRATSFPEGLIHL